MVSDLIKEEELNADQILHLCVSCSDDLLLDDNTIDLIKANSMGLSLSDYELTKRHNYYDC